MSFMVCFQLGFLLSIPGNILAEQGILPDQPPSDQLEFMFLADDTVFYKNPKMRELDTAIGDAKCDIVDMENDIMHQLQSRIVAHMSVLLLLPELAANTDCLITLAICARDFGWERPMLVVDGTGGVSDEVLLQIKSGRHPLLEPYVEPFIPNDLQLSNETGRIHVVTGPNSSGKSIYLKQAGLLLVLAQVGRFVRCIFPNYDKKLQSFESVAVCGMM
eukprot:m.313507 g.313507  ORF g.313507 m.313507 type:complete len:218 (-) comp15968_c0_seq64:4264-4917(-)